MIITNCILIYYLSSRFHLRYCQEIIFSSLNLHLKVFDSPFMASYTINYHRSYFDVIVRFNLVLIILDDPFLFKIIFNAFN